MHRFRKKSDAKHGQVPSSVQGQNLDSQDALPELPPTNDFRTSLILPDLSRRFSLLRSTGDPVLLDQLRTRLADQRARGAENQITEEEEDMFLETLERIRSRTTTTPDRSQENVMEGAEGAPDSVRSAGTSSVTSSPSSRSTKRYSNNLFGSGRLRDYTYLKSVASSRGSSSSTRTVSLTPTEASTRNLSISGMRPVTPDGSITSSSVQSSPNEKHPIRSAPLIPPAPYGDHQLQAISAAEYRLQKTLGPSVLKRASMALDEAIKEIMEDEVEDEILLPRSPPITRGSLEQPALEVRNSQASNTSSVFEGGMAISIDQTIHDEFSERRASPVPARTVPGYVPGMPRPMTPRDFDFDEQRSHSTTPRAQSPYVDPPISPTLSSISTAKMRRGSTSSTAKASPTTPVAAAPLFLNRSTNGRFTPEDSHRSGDAIEFDNPLNSSILGRRRPASPLSGQPYQPMAVSNRPSSRPSTPSNVIWTPNPNNGHKKSHSRNNSWTLDGGLTGTDFQGTLDRHNAPGSRALRSTALPESPVQDLGPNSLYSFASAVTPSKDQPHAYIPDVDLGSPILAAIHAPRSGTPTQIGQRSPISPAFSNFDLSPRNGSKRSSKQHPPSSPFNVSSFPSLGFVPRANSSRDSLDSAGSSFHSWDEGDKVLSVFTDSKEQQPAAWHDFYTDKSDSATTSGGSPDDEDYDPDEILKRYAGLKKADIAAIQEKLVTAAFAKIANTDPRDRAPSSLRRRRPSTSQSNYPSRNWLQIASPPPQAQPPASPSPYATDEHFSKASALLNSMVDSIKEQPPALNTNAAIPPSTPDDNEISPNTRRNRDLALVLFGDDEPSNELPKEETIKPRSEPEPVLTNNNTFSQPTTTLPSQPFREPVTPPVTSPYLLMRNPSQPRIPQTPQQEADLTREVQQKTDAAMLALKKDPSRTNLGEGLKHSPSVRKRIDPSQISTPRLVSASTSVDTIPLRSPSLSAGAGNGPSKLGSRFKKLRGSLRAKNVVSSGEETAVTELSKSPPASQTAYYDPEKLNVPGSPSLSSATETGRFKVPIASPPASAGPGLKGFMARFRNKQRMSEMPQPSGGERSMPRATSPLSPTTPTTPRQAAATPIPTPTGERSHSSLSQRQPGQARPMYSRFPPANPAPVTAPAPTPAPVPQTPAETREATQSAAALEQLYAAANDLGLDQNALSALDDLLARSGSTSSRKLLTRNISVATTTRQGAMKDTASEHAISTQQVTYVGSTGSDSTATPTSYGPRAGDQRLNNVANDAGRSATPEESVTRKPSVRKPDHLRRPKEGQADNAIVRRTIIYPSDTGLSATDFAGIVQRKNSSRRKRVSTQSVSSRSVHDRAPTPPPPKTPTVRRFSADGMPPIPQLPNSLGQAEKMLYPPSTSSGAIEKSNSTYDSFLRSLPRYEMYAGESRAASMAVIDPNGHADQQSSKGDNIAVPESGPALEVIQLANGETIWSIVNGLRDGDDESIYTGRTSFASEYSQPGNDGVQAFVKEHGRSGSKGSTTSFVSRKKSQQGKARPETKVFYSSSAQIGRLIESLSQGVDSGSFNFLPNVPNRPGHSASSSLSTNDINWTVEERLDRMLGAMGNS
ncbi:hypothetical protein B0H34DRAFT_672070 [Crassisporium funariophilum]|nr:hypothetical protein B0H34DRAFT_672070 [Crassisporium funariophilum]